MQLDLINKLTNDYERTNREIEAWYDENVRPKVDLCSTLKELDDVWREIHKACIDHKGQFRDLPGTLNVEKYFSYDAMREKLKDKD